MTFKGPSPSHCLPHPLLPPFLPPRGDEGGKVKLMTFKDPSPSLCLPHPLLPPFLPPRGDEGGKGKLMTFKEFIVKLPDDPSPEEAQARYKRYIIDFHGSELEAEFEEKKHNEE